MKALRALMVVLALSVFVCSWPAPALCQSSQSVPTFTALNPEAPLPVIDVKPLSPRLSSFAGKTIIIYDDHGGYEQPMAGLADQLKAILPADTKIVYYEPKPGFKEDQMQGDAAIIGHGY